MTKNGLGYICIVLGLYFVWNLLTARRAEHPVSRRGEVLLAAGFLAMIAWLLEMADSKRSLVTLLLGALIMVLLRVGVLSRRYVGTTILALARVAVVVEAAFKAVHSVWTVFYIIAMDYPARPRPARRTASPAVRRSSGTVRGWL